MEENDITIGIKRKLVESLKQREGSYVRIMRQWFKMKIPEDQLEAELNKLLTPEEKHLHNQLILALLERAKRIPYSKSDIKTNKSHHKSDLPGHADILKRVVLPSDPPPPLTFKGVLPDQAALNAKLMYGAWEFGLEGSSLDAAELLLIATLNFLKNFLTAIICRRKGFKIHKNKFIHGLGCPPVNPWLKNATKHMSKSDEFHGFEPDANFVHGVLKPEPRLTPEELEQEEIFNLATSDGGETNLLPISLSDVLLTLKLYPSIVPSNFVYTVNYERVLGKLKHPSWEELP